MIIFTYISCNRVSRHSDQCGHPYSGFASYGNGSSHTNKFIIVGGFYVQAARVDHSAAFGVSLGHHFGYDHIDCPGNPGSTPAGYTDNIGSDKFFGIGSNIHAAGGFYICPGQDPGNCFTGKIGYYCCSAYCDTAAGNGCRNIEQEFVTAGFHIDVTSSSYLAAHFSNNFIHEHQYTGAQSY